MHIADAFNARQRRNRLDQLAEPEDGPSATALAMLAKECGVHEFTEEHAEILFDELRKACRAFVQRVKAEAPKEAAVPVKADPDPMTGIDIAAYHRDAQERLAKATPPLATVQTGETGATQTIEPVFEVRPARAVQDLSGPPMVRTEADELAEGMRLAGLA